MNKIIKNFIAKMVAGRADDGIMITLKDPKKVEFQSAILEDLLMRNGIDPRAITSESELKMLLQQIKNAEAAAIRNTDVSGIRGAMPGKVFDLEGKEIPPGSKIMGGKELKFDDDLPPPGSRGGKDDIAAPVQSQEETLRNMTEAEIKANLEKQNKDSVQRILERKNREDVYGLEDYDTTNMSEIKKEIIRTETKLGNLNPNNPDFRERAKPLIDKITELQKKLREDKAKGGRIGLKGGADAATESFGKSAGYSGPSRADPVGGFDLSRGQGPTFGGAPPTVGGGKDDNTFIGGNNNTLRKKIKLPEPVKSGIDTYNNLKYLQNLYKMNPQGIMFDIGRQLLMNKFLSEANTEQDQNMLRADVSQADLDAKKEIRGFEDMDYDTYKSIMEFKGGTNISPFEFKGLQEGTITEPGRYTAADGGRIGYKDGPKFDVQASGTKSGKQQIQNAPKGFTIDNETFNAILKADIPLSEKIDFLASFKYGKSRDRIEKDDQELFLGEGGFKNRNVGLGFNKQGEGIGGTLMYNIETGEPQLNIGFKKSFEDGGRVGYKDGPKMNRRTFLKLFSGLVALPVIGKVLKPLKFGKTVTKVPIIKTDNVPGKPEWFDQLVNKVIIEGDDVTKRFTTGERQSIHQKKLDDGSVVRVTEDMDDGAVRVEYESLDNVYEDPIQMQYKKPLPDEGDPRPTAEFTTAESGPVGRADGPDDYLIDIDEVGGTSISDLTSDVSKLKEYATGKKQTLKEFVQSKKRKDKARKITEGGEAEMDAVIERQGEFIESDLVDIDPPEFASGGIARMLGE